MFPKPLPPTKQKIFNIFVFVLTLVGGAVGGLIFFVAAFPIITTVQFVGVASSGAVSAGLGWLLGFLCGKATGTQEAAESIAGVQGELRTEAPR